MDPTVHRLVVLLDRSPQAYAALPLATGLGQALQVPVALVRVVADEAEAREAQARLAGVAREVEGNGLQAHWGVFQGDPRTVLRDGLAAGDLVLLGLAAQPALGAVPRTLLRETDLPLLLRRAGGRRVRQVRAIGVLGEGRSAELGAAFAQQLGVPWRAVSEAELVDPERSADIDLLVVERPAADLVHGAAQALPVLAI